MKRKITTLLAVLLLTSLWVSAEHTPRHIFQNAWQKIDTSTLFNGKWCPYPDYQDRAGWDKFLGEFKDELIKRGEKYLDYQWQVIKATDYLAFERTGDRSSMERPNGANNGALCSLTLAELAEGKGRFMDQIINGVWFQTERTTWIYSAHQYRQATGRALPDYRDVFIDLATQTTGLQVAASLYFFEKEWDKVDPSIAVAVRHALKEQVFDPYMDASKWKSQSWLGFMKQDEKTPYFWENWDPRNNWNIWCNVNVARIFAFAQPDRKTLLDGLQQAVRSADNYLDFVDMDGGCDEGPAYWSHATGCLYEFIHFMNDITGDKFGCQDDAQYIARTHYLSRANLSNGWSVNFSDGSARSVGNILYPYWMGKLSDDKEMLNYAIYLSAEKGRNNLLSEGGHIVSILESVRYNDRFVADMNAALQKAGGDVKRLKAMCRADIPAGTWYPGTQHFIFKSKSGAQYATKGGHNEESHNHNDVGTVILFDNGMPILVDVGPTTYMRQTFNKKERYTIWSMRSEWHNLPLINGVPQHNGREYAAAWSKADARKGTFSVEMAGAYEKESDCKSLIRSCKLEGNTFTITDKYELNKRLAADEEHFMVRGEVEELGAGRLRIKYSDFDATQFGTAVLTYPKTLTATVETKVLDDARHSSIWGKDLKRIVLKSADNAPLAGSYKIQVTIQR